MRRIPGAVCSGQVEDAVLEGNRGQLAQPDVCDVIRDIAAKNGICF
jgi:hypothetical protein